MSSKVYCNCDTDADFSGAIIFSRIDGLIADNYALFFVHIIMIVFMVIVLWYFVSLLRTTITQYKDAVGRFGKAPPKNDDTEVYDEDEKLKDASVYFSRGKAKFTKDVETTYKEYNKLKGDYIKATYQKSIDDKVDDELFYKEHDDYDYSK